MVKYRRPPQLITIINLAKVYFYHSCLTIFLFSEFIQTQTDCYMTPTWYWYRVQFTLVGLYLIYNVFLHAFWLCFLFVLCLYMLTYVACFVNIYKWQHHDDDGVLVILMINPCHTGFVIIIYIIRWIKVGEIVGKVCVLF